MKLRDAAESAAYFQAAGGVIKREILANAGKRRRV